MASQGAYTCCWLCWCGDGEEVCTAVRPWSCCCAGGALTPPGPCDQPHPKRCLLTPLYPGKESFGWMCLQMPLEFCWASNFTCTLLDSNAAFCHESNADTYHALQQPRPGCMLGKVHTLAEPCTLLHRAHRLCAVTHHQQLHTSSSSVYTLLIAPCRTHNPSRNWLLVVPPAGA